MGTTQVVQAGGTVTADTSGTGWSFDSAAATLTLNGANITTTAHDGISDATYRMFYYGIYCDGDLNIVVTGDSTIDARAADFKSNGIYVRGNLSVSGSAKLTTTGNWNGLAIQGDLAVSGAVDLRGLADSSTNSNLTGIMVGPKESYGDGTGNITVSDTASLTSHALVQLTNCGMQCTSGNIIVGSGATLTAIADDGYSGTGSESYGLKAGYDYSPHGQVSIEGTLVASSGDAGDHGYAAGLYLYKTDLIVSGNGSVRAESGESPNASATAYGVKTDGGASIIKVNAGGFLASGGTGAVYPATTNVTIDGTPVYYEVSANRDGSGAAVCTDTDTWNSTYNGQFGTYKYINATTLYEVYVNGTQVTRVNRSDVLGDGTVSYLPSADGSPARLTLDGASLSTLQLDGGTELALTGTNTVGTVTNAGAVTVSGSGGLTLTGSLDCGSASLTVENGAAVTVQGTVTAGAVVNGGTLINEGTLVLPEATTVEQIQAINLTGDGIVKAGSRVYLGGILYADGGDKSSSGIDLSTLPAEGTYYTAGSGYAIFTPATTDPAANAKLALHGAQISTTGANALTLPTAAPVDIIVASDSSLMAGGSGNVIMTNGQTLCVTGSGDLTLAGPYYGISVNGTGAVSINIDGDLTFDVASQPISTTGNIIVSAKSITSKTGYYFYGNNVSLTATDGDISLTTKHSGNGAVSGSGGVSLAASKGAVTIHHSDNANGGYALQGTEVFVSALKGVTITTSRGAIKASSGAVSVSSTTGSIQMDCGDYYECITAHNTGDAITLSAAKNITLNGSATDTTAIAASSRTVDITAGGALTSTSAYGFQVGALTIKANEVSVAGTAQDGIQAGSVSISNPTGGNCESVSVTATSSSTDRAAIYSTGDVTVKADDVFICGKDSAKAISAQGTVTIDGAEMIVGTITAGTNNIDSRIICAANGGDKSGGLDLYTTAPSVSTYYTADNGYILWNPTDHTVTLHNAIINNTSGNGLTLPNNMVVILEGTNLVTSENKAGIYGDGALTVQGSGSLNASGDAGGLLAEQITVTGSADVKTDGIYTTLKKTNLRSLCPAVLF